VAKKKTKDTELTPKQKKKVEASKRRPSLSDFIGLKLTDVSGEDGKAYLHFSNNYKLILSGNISFKVEEVNK